MTVRPRHRKLLLVAAAAAMAAAAVLVPTVGGTPPGDFDPEDVPGPYEIVPDPPVLMGFDPPSGSNDNMPSIKGTAADAEVVRFYGDAQCSEPILIDDDGVILQVNDVVDGEFSALVDVADNTGIVVFAAAARGGPESDCSNGITYIELTPPPPTVVTRTVVKTRVVTRKVIVEAPLPEPLAGATLVSPTNGGRILDAPVFEWQTPSGEETSAVIVSEAVGGVVFYGKPGPGSASWAAPSALPAGSYRWTVETRATWRERMHQTATAPERAFTVPVTVSIDGTTAARRGGTAIIGIAWSANAPQATIRVRIYNNNGKGKYGRTVGVTRESMVGNETTSFVYVPKKRQRGQRHTAEINRPGRRCDNHPNHRLHRTAQIEQSREGEGCRPPGSPGALSRTGPDPAANPRTVRDRPGSFVEGFPGKQEYPMGKEI